MPEIDAKIKLKGIKFDHAETISPMNRGPFQRITGGVGEIGLPAP